MLRNLPFVVQFAHFWIRPNKEQEQHFLSNFRFKKQLFTFSEQLPHKLNFLGNLAQLVESPSGVPYKKYWEARRKYSNDPKLVPRSCFCGCGLKCFSPLRGTKILFCGCGLKCFSPLRGTKILFCRCGWKLFSTLRGANFEATQYLLSFFWLNTLKGACWPFELEQLINPWRVQQTPGPFYMGDDFVATDSLEEQKNFLTICSSTLPCFQCAIFKKSGLRVCILLSLSRGFELKRYRLEFQLVSAINLLCRVITTRPNHCSLAVYIHLYTCCSFRQRM